MHRAPDPVYVGDAAQDAVDDSSMAAGSPARRDWRSDLDAGRDAMREFLALYLGGMGPKGKNFYVNAVIEYGFGTKAEKVQDLYLAGHKAEAAAALPEALIDAVSIVGTPDVVRDRLTAFRSAGVGTVLCSMTIDTSIDEKIRQLELLAEAAAA